MSVTEEEVRIALCLVSSSRITPAAILDNSRTDIEEFRSLSLKSTVDTLMLLSENRPVRVFQQDGKWMTKV